MPLTLLKGLLMNLKGEIPERMRREYVSKEDAHRRLKEVTGQRFAIDDIDAWARWIKEHPRVTLEGFRMLEQEYIAEVCRENILAETVDWLLQSDEDRYFADRHVAEPPEGLSAHAACLAGFALLEDWAADLAEFKRRGLFGDEPVLMIDQEWLDELPDAPPPHVILGIAKNGDALPPSELSGHPADPADSPLRDLLEHTPKQVAVRWIEPREELEHAGAWLFVIEG